MKIYNLNIDTSKPTNQVVLMQQGATGLLNPNVTNGGKYIRNLTTKVYDGGVEVPSTEKGFKIDVGTEPKHVKVVASSTPMESIKEKIASFTPGTRPAQKFLKRIVIPAGTYRQDEFESLKQFGNYSGIPTILFDDLTYGGEANFNRIQIRLWDPNQKIWFGTQLNSGGKANWLSPDEPLIVNEEIAFGNIVNVKTSKPNSIVLSSETYPAIGYYTDYQMDTLVKPSDNAPYDGNYVEPVKEIEVDGVKFVPTTLTIDGVDYKVLAEAQPDEEPVDSTDSELDSTDSELNDGE